MSDYDLAVFRRAHGEPELALPPKPRKSQGNEESRIQQAVIRWFSYAYGGLGIRHEFLLFAVPNGHRRDAITASILKREGLRAGVSDLVLAVPRGPFHGLFLELKTNTGTPSDQQRAFLAAVEAEGYCAKVANGYDQAVQAITKYAAWNR